MTANKAPKQPANKAPDDNGVNADAETVKTVDGVEVYEPHVIKQTYKPGDATYGRKKACMLADGTYPDTDGDE